MKQHYSFLVGFIMIFLIPYTANAQTTLTSQPNSCYGKDAHVVNVTSIPSSVNVNYGTLNELVPLTWTFNGSIGYARAFIDFVDLQSIPQGATVASASLYLYGPTSSNTAPQGNSGDNKCWVQRVTSSWSQSTVTWANQPSVTTTNQTSIASSTSQWSYNPVINVTQLVQDMVNLSPSQRNGFCIRLQTEGTYRSIVFASSNASSASLHPKIVVTYTYCPSLPLFAPLQKNVIYTPDVIDPNAVIDAFSVKVSPNPSNSFVNVEYELPIDGPATIKLLSLSTGNVLKVIQSDGIKGKHIQKVSLSNVNNENIVVQVAQGDISVSKKISIIK